MVATKAGHDNIKELLQPVRQQLVTKLPEINSAVQFMKARQFVKDYGLQRLKHEMGVSPHLESSANQREQLYPGIHTRVVVDC